MKKKSKMILCLLILVALLAVLILVSRMNQEDAAEEEAKDTIEVTNADQEKVTGLSFLIGGEKVSFTKTDDTWICDQEEAFPLDQSSVDTVVGKLVSLSAEQTLEDDSVELADYGLAEPSNVATFTDENGTTKIAIGAENPTTGIWYLYLNDNTGKIYLVDQSFDSVFPDDLMSFAEGETLPSITAENITNIQVENGEGSYQLASQTEDDITEWTITDASGFSHEADGDQVSSLTSTLSSLSYGDMVEYNCEDMEQYGLGDSAAKVKIHYTEEQTVEDSEDEDDDEVSSEDETAGSESSEDAAENGQEAADSETEDAQETVIVEKDLALLIGSQKEDGSYYVTMEGSKEVHTMSESTVDSILNTEVSSYWNLYVSPVTVTDILSMDVTYNGQTNTIVRNTEETTDEDGDTTQTITYTWDGEEVDKTEASTLYSAAVSMTAQSKELGLEKTSGEELVLVMHTDGGSYTVSYSPYDSSFYYVTDLEGVPSLVNKNKVNDLIDAYLTVIGEK